MDYDPYQAQYRPQSDPTPPDSGNMSSCYTCDRDLTRLDEKYIDRRYHTYTRHDYESKSVQSETKSYVMSLCIWCGSMFPKS